jgi:hypothetical protein
VAGRFPLYTDADIQGPLVDGLRAAGWDVVRAIEIFPEKTKDPVHFAEAARLGRVLVTNDRRIPPIAYAWLAEGKRFPGLITWPQSHYSHGRVGAFLHAFEELAQQDDPFGNYPIIHITIAE